LFNSTVLVKLITYYVGIMVISRNDWTQIENIISPYEFNSVWIHFLILAFALLERIKFICLFDTWEGEGEGGGGGERGGGW